LKSNFDDIIYIYNTTDSISKKINYYVSKASDVKSDTQLSAREIEVLTMVAKGCSNKQIAGQLFISIHTVITHRKNITFKLGIKSISGLTLYAALNNLVDSRY
jgi:DNA-binding CsgD family transcriptional regulator